MKNKHFFQAVKNAVAGIFSFFANERNGKIHLAIAILVLIISFIFGINKQEWIIIILLCAVVIASEMLNTAIEKICDKITKEYDADIKFIKDVSSGAVLVLCVAAVIIGLIILLPYFIKTFIS